MYRVLSQMPSKHQCIYTECSIYLQKRLLHFYRIFEMALSKGCVNPSEAIHIGDDYVSY